MVKRRKASGAAGKLLKGTLGAGRMSSEFLVLIIIMLLCGLIMVASASSASALYRYNDSMFFVKKQLMYAGIGLVIMFVVSYIDYHLLAKLKIPIMAVTWLLMLAAAFIGPNLNGARRWLEIGSFTFQPSELAKISTIILFADIYSEMDENKINDYWKSTVKMFALIGFICIPLALQPHKSALTLIGILCITMMFMAGTKVWHLLTLLPFALAALGFIIYKDAYSLARVFSFLDPFKDLQGDGWQAAQSLYAIGSGGLFGLGLGRSRQKFLYIPEPQNDFIFAIICEELGFIGAAFVLLLFALFILHCLKISAKAPDKLGALIGGGITALIAIQVIINIAVVTASMPVTGMQLPFFSAGGSSLMFLLGGMGIMLNISRYSSQSARTKDKRDE